jgi:hypothetical protein
MGRPVSECVSKVKETVFTGAIPKSSAKAGVMKSYKIVGLSFMSASPPSKIIESCIRRLHSMILRDPLTSLSDQSTHRWRAHYVIGKADGQRLCDGIEIQGKIKQLPNPEHGYYSE